MKTYLEELKGQVRGNARLRRRLDESNRRRAELIGHAICLVNLLNKLGHGGKSEVKAAAHSLGWNHELPEADKAALQAYSKGVI